MDEPDLERVYQEANSQFAFHDALEACSGQLLKSARTMMKPDQDGRSLDQRWRDIFGEVATTAMLADLSEQERRDLVDAAHAGKHFTVRMRALVEWLMEHPEVAGGIPAYLWKETYHASDEEERGARSIGIFARMRTRARETVRRKMDRYLEMMDGGRVTNMAFKIGVDDKGEPYMEVLDSSGPVGIRAAS